MKVAMLLLCAVAQLGAACLIRGTVVDLESGKPIAKAKVYAKPQGHSGVAIVYTTDDQGAFCFDLLDAASYQVVADRSGYLPAVYGARPGGEDGMPIKADGATQVPPLVLKMVHGASIAGLALHANGEPLDGAAVDLSRKTWDHGWHDDNVTTEITDERGCFRFARLAPGNYYLSIHPRSYFHEAPAFDEKGLPIRAREALTFYSASPTFDRATPIILKPGQEVTGLTLAVGASGLRRFSGRVAGFAPSPHSDPTLQLASKDAAASTPIRTDGTFSAEGLEPGRYTAFVSGANASAEVDLTNGDIDGFVIEPRESLEFRLSARVENQPSQKVDLRLHGIGGDWPKVVNPQAGPCCTFSNVTPETYRVMSNGGNDSGDYYLKALLINGRAQPDNLLDLRGSVPGLIEAVFSTKVAQIEGETESMAGASSGLAVTVVVMAEAISKVEVGGPNQTVDQSGEFSFHGLAPGIYRVFAIESFDEDLWGSPELANSLASKSVELELGESDKKQIKLPVIQAEEWTAALRKIGM